MLNWIRRMINPTYMSWDESTEELKQLCYEECRPK